MGADPLEAFGDFAMTPIKKRGSYRHGTRLFTYDAYHRKQQNKVRRVEKRKRAALRRALLRQQAA